MSMYPTLPKEPGANGLRIIVALLAALGLGEIAYSVVTHGSLTNIDGVVLGWGQAHATPGLIAAMTWVSRSGGPSMTSVYVAVFVIVWLVRRQIATAVGVAAIIYGGAGLNIALKDLVQRGRPVVEYPTMTLITYSFPSGHAAAATVFGGILIMLVLRDDGGIRRTMILVGAIVIWVASVCVSRIVLSLHYPTDVAAGFLEGIAWLSVGSLALDRWRVPLDWPHLVASRQ